MKYSEFYQSNARIKKQRILSAAKELKANFDYISKKDAIMYLADLYPFLSIRDRIESWKLAYQK